MAPSALPMRIMTKRINRFANALTNLGVGQGDVVSFITYNSHQLLEAYYAVPQIEGILNPINIRLTHHEIEYILNHAETRVLCFHQDFLPLVENMRDQIPRVEHFIIMESKDQPDWALDYESLLANAPPEAEIDLDGIDEDAVIELFYTSGTTGPPKGVQITNRSLYIHTLTAIPGFRVSDHDTLLHVVPLISCQWLGITAVLDRSWGKACHAAQGRFRGDAATDRRREGHQALGCTHDLQWFAPASRPEKI